VTQPPKFVAQNLPIALCHDECSASPAEARLARAASADASSLSYSKLTVGQRSPMTLQSYNLCGISIFQNPSMLNAGNTFGTTSCTKIIIVETQDATPIVYMKEPKSLRSMVEGNRTGKSKW
jgi:hypothetical protein